MSNTYFTLGFQVKDAKDQWTDLMEVGFDGAEKDTISSISALIENGFRPHSVMQTASLQLQSALVAFGATNNPAKALRIVIARTRLRSISQIHS